MKITLFGLKAFLALIVFLILFLAVIFLILGLLLWLLPFILIILALWYLFHYLNKRKKTKDYIDIKFKEK